MELKAKDASVRLGRFDRELACLSGNSLYAVKEFLADGTPVYEIKKLNASGLYRLDNGSIVALDAKSPVYKSGENAVYAPDGARVWGYPTDFPSVSGLYLPPWRPGYVTNQFAIIGHETARAGDLGEYFVVHANNGQWNLWTADGLLAGHVLLHVQDKRSHNFIAPLSALGTRLDPLSAGQEHFHGFFTQSEKDGRAYIIAGSNFMSIAEVKGLEKFKRTQGEIKVAPDDIQRVRTWESDHTRKEILSSLSVIESRRAPKIPNIDGIRGEGEWPEPSSTLDDVQFTLTYDANNLYVSYFGESINPLKNSGNEFQRYFKTGACLDLQLGTDPKADPKRSAPVPGDLRLLVTLVKGKPYALLYRAVVPGVREPVAFSSPWRTITIDRVENVSDQIQLAGADGNYEFSVPLQLLGLKPAAGLTLKGDIGLLRGNGFQTLQRVYWSNKATGITADVPSEAMLAPLLWGSWIFSTP